MPLQRVSRERATSSHGPLRKVIRGTGECTRRVDPLDRNCPTPNDRHRHRGLRPLKSWSSATRSTASITQGRPPRMQSALESSPAGNGHAGNTRGLEFVLFPGTAASLGHLAGMVVDDSDARRFQTARFRCDDRRGPERIGMPSPFPQQQASKVPIIGSEVAERSGS